MTALSSNRVPAMGLSASPATSASSHPYTCNTCQVAFRNSDLQRGHMRSDWHRYNLKRRVTSLPPITSETFTEKVLAAQASSNAAASKAAYEKTCPACEKTYFSENAYYNHVGSQKHRTRLALLQGKRNEFADDGSSSIISSNLDSELTATGPDYEAEANFSQVIEGMKGTTLEDEPAISESTSGRSMEIDGTNGKTEKENGSSSQTISNTTNPDVNLRRCLFCNYESPTIDLNVTHMERIHGMFIPERNYLVDLDGLITALFEKINIFHECLYCGKLKSSIFGLQTHMRDMGHCKIPFATEDEQLEIGEFYDFTSTYSDVEEDDSDDEVPVNAKSGAKLGAKGVVDLTPDDEEMEDAEGWETDSSASSLDSNDLTAVPLDQHEHQYEKLDRHPHHSSQDPRPHRNKDGWHSHAHKHAHAAFYSDYELHLPSGRSVGHRSLNKYYRQNLHKYPTPEERQAQNLIKAAIDSDSETEDQQMEGQTESGRGRALISRANGGMGMIGVTDQKKREIQAVEKRARKVEEREKRKFQWGNNKQNNFQKHFRDPLLQ